MTTALLTLAAIVAAAPFALMALHWLLLSYSREQGAAVADAVRALPDVPLHLKADALLCFDQAAAADQKTALYDVTAPLVMLLVLPFVKRGANRLPRAFRRWDNNVSINGDGEAVLRDGQWINLRDIGWAPNPGERVYTYDDPAYTGDAYYATGHHPRSYWARYIWLGWRNRASKLSLDLGITARKDGIELLAGDVFLSCLCGSELAACLPRCDKRFLSCLCGSELDPIPPNLLILKNIPP